MLKQIEPAANHYGNSTKEGDCPSSRKEAARNAGMSEHQQKQAGRIASVPEQDFEAHGRVEVDATDNFKSRGEVLDMSK